MTCETDRCCSATGRGDRDSPEIAGSGGGVEVEAWRSSSEAQPPARNAGAEEELAGGSGGEDSFCQPPPENEGAGGAGGADDGGGGGGGVAGGSDPLTADHPARLNPEGWAWLDGLDAARDTQPPDFFGASMAAAGSAIATVLELAPAIGKGLGILMPLAAAILRSSFSSLFRSFSFRLSRSSFGTMRALACKSLSRAL